MKKILPTCWSLDEELEKPYFRALEQFVDGERRAHLVYPAEDSVFEALRRTPFDSVKVVLLGQDPYHGPGQAHGLAFSVLPGVKPPPSLVNILREMHDDLGCRISNTGCLMSWADQGVLLLNTVMTVRAGEANSHKGKGWEAFTDAVLRKMNEKPGRVVFLLWGGSAQKKKVLIDEKHHVVIQSAHPSPLSARTGFFGSRPFSRTNHLLSEAGETEINWELP